MITTTTGLSGRVAGARSSEALLLESGERIPYENVASINDVAL
jgi:hypothetical protein